MLLAWGLTGCGGWLLRALLLLLLMLSKLVCCVQGLFPCSFQLPVAYQLGH